MLELINWMGKLIGKQDKQSISLNKLEMKIFMGLIKIFGKLRQKNLMTKFTIFKDIFTLQLEPINNHLVFRIPYGPT